MHYLGTKFTYSVAFCVLQFDCYNDEKRNNSNHFSSIIAFFMLAPNKHPISPQAQPLFYNHLSQ